MKGFTPHHFLSQPSHIILNITKSGGGFTIPELLISVFVIVLMTAIVVPSWRGGETTLALDRAAHKLAQDLRKATELSQRAQFFECNHNPPKTSGYKISGYGVYISTATPASYILYVECNGNQEYDEDADVIFPTPTDTIAIENKIQISSVTPSSFSVFFVPPVPNITIQPGSLSQAQITLSVVGDPSRSKTITVTTKGIIDID